MTFTSTCYVDWSCGFVRDDCLNDRGLDLYGNGDAFWDDLEEEEYNNDALARMRNVGTSEPILISKRNNEDINPEVHVHTSILKGVNRNRKIDLKMNAFERRL